MIRYAIAAVMTSVLLISGNFLFAQPAPAADQPSRWPMHAQTSDGADVTIFQPQMEDFQGDTLSARAAVSVIPAGQQQPVFGAIWLQSRVSTDRVARTVHVLDVQVTRDRFPDADPVSEQALAAAVRQVILSEDITLSLDQLLEMLQTIQKAQTAASDLQSPAPTIVFRDHPAVKVQYDGTPRMVQDEKTKILRAINTPFFVAMDPAAGPTYYLKGAGEWFAAADPMGPFQAVQNPPASLVSLADSSGYQDPEKTASDAQAPSVEIVTATNPTELIWTDGQPQLSTVPGTGLLYWANTTSDVFVDIGTQQTYVLLSGRWYSAHSTSGPWANVPPDKLPADFSRIPADSEKAEVLASVAGTPEAQDAVADTYLPQTAAVDVNHFDQPPVEYDGDPNFVVIPNTNCSYADNTSASVLLVGGNYYCCFNAVWYLSPHPIGPWGICRRVPREIYTIPPSCPLYPVRFVAVYGFTPDVVYVGYTPGYVGCYTYDGTVVFGTGYYYRPWVGGRYFARPSTFGFAARYDPYSGHWGFNFAVAGGGGGLWIGNDRRYTTRGVDWFGFGGFRPSMVRDTAHINPNIVRFNNDNLHRREAQSSPHDAFVRNIYDRRSDLHRELVGQPRAEPGRANVSRVPAAQAPVARQDNTRDDVYTDRSGNVYRRTDHGWEQRTKAQWQAEQPEQPHAKPAAPTHTEPQPVQPPHSEGNPNRGEEQPANPPPQENRGDGQADQGDRDRELNRDYKAREAGENRQREYQPRSQQQPDRSAPANRSDGNGGDRSDGKSNGQSDGRSDGGSNRQR